MTYIDDAEQLGYTVSVATDEPPVYRVEGFGISLMLGESDDEAWTRLLTIEAHEYRKMMSDETPEPTRQEAIDAQLAASVALGDITQEQADDPAYLHVQRDEAEYVRVANITETDWIITPPPDTEQSILNQINNNLAGWQTFRRELRALPIVTIPDPTQLVWPTHPIRPATALTQPPTFVTTA